MNPGVPAVVESPNPTTISFGAIGWVGGYRDICPFIPIAPALRGAGFVDFGREGDWLHRAQLPAWQAASSAFDEMAFRRPNLFGRTATPDPQPNS